MDSNEPIVEITVEYRVPTVQVEGDAVTVFRKDQDSFSFREITIGDNIGRLAADVRGALADAWLAGEQETLARNAGFAVSLDDQLTSLQATNSQQSQRIAELERVEAAQMGRIQRLQEVQFEFERDAERISEALIAKAEEKGWCGEYEDFVSEVNRRNTHIELRHREADFTAQLIVPVSFTCAPGDAQEMADRIAMALYNRGDNLGDDTYTIGTVRVDEVEQD